MEKEERICPSRGAAIGRHGNGKNRSGTLKYRRRNCGKRRAYAEELRRNAIKTLCADAKDRKIGRVSGVSKAGVYNWIKKLRGIRKSELCGTALNELDDLLNPS